MGNIPPPQQGGNQGGNPPSGDPNDPSNRKKPKKFEPRPVSRVGKKKRNRGPSASTKLPVATPSQKCKLRMLKMERIKDYLLMEDEYIKNQEALKPKKEKDEEERTKVDEIRGSPMSVGTLEEIIDDSHAIVSSTGPEYYVSILSIVDLDQLEPGASVLLHNKTMSIVGILNDDADPLVATMKVDKAPSETYADIGGLEQQIMEIKEVC